MVNQYPTVQGMINALDYDAGLKDGFRGYIMGAIEYGDTEFVPSAYWAGYRDGQFWLN